jgi:hypothetical protein
MPFRNEEIDLVVSNLVTYRSTFGFTTLNNGTASGLYIWHPSTSGRRAELVRVSLSVVGGAGTGYLGFFLYRITAQGSGGGTASSTVLDPDDAAATCTVTYAATTNPTRGPLVETWAATVSQALVHESRAPLAGCKRPTMRAGVAEGYELAYAFAGTPTTLPALYITFEWTET